MGITRLEFHDRYSKGDPELARRVDRLWRATDPESRTVPFATMLLGFLVVSLPVLGWRFDWSSSTILGTKGIGIWILYFAGVAALLRGGLGDGRAADETLIAARIEFPYPLPEEWIPTERTLRNWMWRAHVLQVELGLVETNQLAPSQLEGDAESYRVRVEDSVATLFSAVTPFARLVGRFSKVLTWPKKGRPQG